MTAKKNSKGTGAGKAAAAEKKPARPKRSSLGQGLSALLGADDVTAAGMAAGTGAEGGAATAAAAETARLARPVPIEAITPNPDQPRRHFEAEAIEALAQSLRTRGVLQPILVRPHPSRSGAYEIVAGERRWRAAQKARLHEVPVIIRDMDDSGALEVALVENIQRENLNPLEEAEGYRRLMEDFGHTQAALAKLLGKSRSHIANTLRLLNLPKSVQAMLADGRLSAGHGRALLAVDNPEEAAKSIISGGLNVRQAEKMAGAGKGETEKAKAGGADAPTKQASKKAFERDPNVVALEKNLSNRLGLRTVIDAQGEKGLLIIQYQTLEQLDDLIGLLNR